MTGPDLLDDTFDPDERPSLWRTVKALRTTHPRFPWVQPTAEEAEVADLLEELDELHKPVSDEPDNPAEHPLYRTYGECLGCGEVWPCAGYVNAEQLAVQWIGRAADRVYARAKTAADKLGKTGAA